MKSLMIDIVLAVSALVALVVVIASIVRVLV